MTDDTVLIARARSNDKHAFRVLIGRYQSRVFSLAWELTGNRCDAEDLMQEVFFSLYRSVETFRGNSSLGTWLYRTTSNTWIDIIRSKAYKARMGEQPAAYSHRFISMIADQHATGNPERIYERKQIREQVSQSLDSLSPRERSAFMLRHYHGLRIAEIAHTISVAEGTVKSLLYRAHAKLRKRLYFLRPDHREHGRQMTTAMEKSAS